MQKRSSFLPIFLIFLTLTLLIFVLSRIGALNGLNGFLQTASLPLQRMTYGIFNNSGNEDQSESSKLKDENNKQSIELAKLEELKRENQALRDQFQTATQQPQELLPASVIGTRENQLTIDRGTNDGVQSGNAVIFKDNLLGRVSRTSPHFSVVELVTNEDISLTAKTSKTQAIGIVKGQGSSLVLENVTLSDKLEKGDLVITKGDINEKGVGFVPNLVIGKIDSINKKSSDLFQTAEVKSLVDFQKIEAVFVMIAN